MTPPSVSITPSNRLAVGLGVPVLLLLVASFATGCREADADTASARRAPVSTAALGQPPAPYVHAESSIEAGRYLIVVGGCNDCHTPGYLQTDGNVPESEWLTGSIVGFRGPWGTTYPSNLRLSVQDYDEDVFVQMMRSRKAMAPMPWPSVNRMSEQDVRSIYRYIASLGPQGQRMPAAVAPDVEPNTPYFDFVPKHMERLAAAAPPEAAGTEAP